MKTRIFGRSKSFDLRKTEKYSKDRRIRCQFINLGKHGICLNEYKSVKSAVGKSICQLMGEVAREYEENFIEYLEKDREEKNLEYRNSFLIPIVRNTWQAVIEHKPDSWKEWV